MLTLDKIDAEIYNIIEHGDNRSDIATLADLYICRDAMRSQPTPEKISASGSEFAVCINGKCFSEVFPILDELVETLKVMQPRLYESFMRKLL